MKNSKNNTSFNEVADSVQIRISEEVERRGINYSSGLEQHGSHLMQAKVELYIDTTSASALHETAVG
jgi:hypothetical protein